MISLFIEMLSYPFLSRAIIVGALISVSAALLGIILVSKRFSMIGNSLSHVGFGTMAISKVLVLDPVLFSMPILVLIAFLLLKINENTKIKGDQLLGILSVSSLAIGVMSIYHSTGVNTDVCNYLFGSILAMKDSDVYLSIIVSSFIIVLFILYYNEIFAITFDEEYAKTSGVKISMYNFAAAALTAIIIILGMRMMGALLISSLIIFPSITANRVFYTFKSVTIASGVISLVCFLIGITLSYMFSFPTGASIVIVNLIFFAVFTFVENLFKREVFSWKK